MSSQTSQDCLTAALNDMPPFIGIKQLAELLDVPEQTVRKWNKTGAAPPRMRIGVHVRYARGDVAEWLRSKYAGAA